MAWSGLSIERIAPAIESLKIDCNGGAKGEEERLVRRLSQ